MTNPSIFNTILVWPIINVLVAVYKGLIFVNFPFALGFSIIILTIIIRFILYPLTSSQLKASKKMQDLNPHLANLKNKHKGDSKTLQQETMKLYKEHGVNPAAGCLPVIIQLPIIWGLYSALQQIANLKPDVINKIVYFDALKLTKAWDPNFFGVSLGSNPSYLISTVGPVILIIPLLTALFQFIQSKMMFSKPRTQGVLVKIDEKKKDTDFASAFQSQSMYIFPVMIGFFSWTFPVGLSLYWNTFTIFGIIQQYRVSGLGGLEDWKNKIYGQKTK
ncbi:MAG: YidC/Oxa1 family membrane protein insertase [Patescibacteria group bacterium]|nr:YidC/Oxa1 family membrane protein insertase [Patescibacteria group bacterium]